METVSLLDRKPVLSGDEILSRMQGHICRCCTYSNIANAIHRAAAQTQR